MVTIGSQPSYKRDEFYSYGACVSAAQAEVDSLGPNVRWACVASQGNKLDASATRQ